MQISLGFLAAFVDQSLQLGNNGSPPQVATFGNRPTQANPIHPTLIELAIDGCFPE